MFQKIGLIAIAFMNWIDSTEQVKQQNHD